MIELIRDGVISNTKNKKYIIDTADELGQLDIDFGNEAYCITEKTTYICNGSGRYIEKKSSGGGSGIEIESLSVTANGIYTADEGKAYSPVNVHVPASEVDSGIKYITTNGVHSVVGYADVDVNVEISIPSAESNTF